jgi:hypothetical protein
MGDKSPVAPSAVSTVRQHCDSLGCQADHPDILCLPSFPDGIKQFCLFTRNLCDTG